MSQITELIFCYPYATIFSLASIIYPQQQTRVHLTSEQIEMILNGCRLNQRNAQKELYRKYYGYAMSIALRYASNYDNAVEMVNDAFLKIYRDLKNFVPRYDNTVASFNAWLKQVVICACIDHIRKYNKKETMTSVDSEQVVIADERETAEQMLQYKEIIKCIQQLSPAYKAVFNLYVIEGFSHAEIADKLNISENTSKSNLHNARQNLQQLLKRSNIISYERTL
jgi:RNA polymerase sigma factor (sigma-70 family)